MLINLLTTTGKSLLRNKLYCLINIGGLALGLATCMFIGLYVQQEASYDRHWQDTERLYRLTTTADRTGGNPVRMGNNSLALLPAMRDYFADAIDISSQSVDFLLEDVYVGAQLFEQRIVQAEPSLTALFDFVDVHGSLAATLDNPALIALSEDVALRWFGRADVVGEVLTLVETDGRADYRVGAVYRLAEGNTVLDLPALRRMNVQDFEAGWMTFSSRDYLTLKPGVDVAELRARLPAFIDQVVDISLLAAGANVRPSERISVELQPMQDVYLHSSFETNAVRGSAESVLFFALIAVLVLLVACINFALLSTAKATRRRREMAIRKSIGSSRWQLMLHFMVEAVLLVLAGMLLAVVLVEISLPLAGAMSGRVLEPSYAAPGMFGFLLGLVLFVGALGGLYPSLRYSGFQPASALKSNTPVTSRAALRLRGVLVIVQFGISIALMIGTAAVYLQLRYTLERDAGFSSDNVLVIENLLVRPDVNLRKDALETAVAAIPGVLSTSLAGHQPMQTIRLSTIVPPFTLAGAAAVSPALAALSVDQDFFRTYQIPIVAGRDFQQGLDQVSSFFPFVPLQNVVGGSLVVNASAARAFGFSDPAHALGRQVSASSWSPHSFTIVGVVADTQFYSLRSQPRAEVYVLTPAYSEVLAVRYEGNPGPVIAQVESIWRDLMGDAELSWSFVDGNMSEVFRRERTEARMMIAFSLLAISIACLGLFGTVIFNVMRRTREIGIRKVMGAQVREIVRMLLWHYSLPVLLANLIACPVALWMVLQWLQRFPYRMDAALLLPICVAAGLLALCIAWVTVAGTAVKAAGAKPVVALRYE